MDDLVRIDRTKYCYISKDGRLYNKYTDKWYTGNVDKRGSRVCYVTDGTDVYHINIGYEVAKAYVPNPNGYKRISYIDGDSNNCSYDNIVWTKHVTHVKSAMGTVPIAVRSEVFDVISNNTLLMNNLSELGKYLNMDIDTILSKAKGSHDRPILGRYRVKVNLDDFDMLYRHTRRNYKPVTVYDVVENKYATYNTGREVIYHTETNIGMYNLTEDDVVSYRGYVIGMVRDNVVVEVNRMLRNNELPDKANAKYLRDKYRRRRNAQADGAKHILIYNKVTDNAMVVSSVRDAHNVIRTHRKLTLDTFRTKLSRAYGKGVPCAIGDMIVQRVVPGASINEIINNM